MISEAWNNGKEKSNWKKKIENYAKQYAIEYLNEHNKEQIVKIVTNMGKRNEKSYNLGTYLYFDNNHMSCDNLKPEFVKFDKEFKECQMDQIWSSLYKPIFVNLSEINEDEDYNNLYIMFKRGCIDTNYRPTPRNMREGIDGVCIELVYYESSSCNIL